MEAKLDAYTQLHETTDELIGAIGEIVKHLHSLRLELDKTKAEVDRLRAVLASHGIAVEP